uniref:Putative secreted peptide n=1 Tax=Anopheles braziliensis TaxID=58242 RepID=A0A2M3ZUB5_9DIPT
MEPKVATRLTQDALIVVMYLLMAPSAGVDGRGVRVLGVEHLRLIGRVQLTGGDGHRFRAKHTHMMVMIRSIRSISRPGSAKATATTTTHLRSCTHRWHAAHTATHATSHHVW